MADEDEGITLGGHTLPAVIKIGPTYFEIDFGTVPDSAWAITDPAAHRVTLDPTLPDQSSELQKSTIVHEVVHLLNYVYLPVVTNQKGYRAKIRQRDLDEMIAAAFGYGWLGFLRDNPAWVLYLMEGVFYGFAIAGNGNDSGAGEESGDQANNAGYL